MELVPIEFGAITDIEAYFEPDEITAVRSFFEAELERQSESGHKDEHYEWIEQQITRLVEIPTTRRVDIPFDRMLAIAGKMMRFSDDTEAHLLVISDENDRTKREQFGATVGAVAVLLEAKYFDRIMLMGKGSGIVANARRKYLNSKLYAREERDVRKAAKAEKRANKKNK